ncbi:MAG TPA: site-specific integrase [Candidatus Saccharimonadales bacterium]|nr:site-specific integrase [Candidatus Saccharimonadales bacterium]
MLTSKDLQNLLPSFIEHLSSRNSSRSTIKNYSSDLRKILEAIKHEDPLGQEDLSEVLQSLRGQFSDSTLRRFSYSLKAFISWAESKGYELPKVSPIKAATVATAVQINSQANPVEAYVTHLQSQGTSPTTSKYYKKDLENFFTWLKPGQTELKTSQVSKVNRFDINRYTNYLRSKHFSESSIDRYLYSLKDFFSFQRKKVVYDNNPVQKGSAVAGLALPFLALKIARPRWWHAYRGHPMSDYANWTVAAVAILLVSFMTYHSLFPEKKVDLKNLRADLQKGLVLAATPPRILSFQGRLTNPSGTPTTATTNVVFKIYDDRTLGGGHLKWTSKTWSVTPDQNGLFSVCLGGQDTSDDCLIDGIADTAIPASLFSDNAALYLGVTIGSDSEAVPRQRIASATYALNSDALDGLDSTSFLRADASSNLLTGNTLQLNDGSTFTVNSSTIGIGNAAGDTVTVNGATTFNTDVDLTFAGTENVAMTSDLAGTVNVISLVATPSSTSGTTQGVFVQQANSANSNGLDVGIKIDNADSDLAIGDGLNFANTGGGGYTNYINSANLIVTGAGVVKAADLTLGLNDSSATISTQDTDENLTIDPNGTGTIFFHGATYGITSSGVLTVAACSGCGAASLTPWTSDVDADGFDLNDLSNILFRETTGAPTGSDVSLFRDNSGDLNLNVLTGKSFNVQVNGSDEYNFSSTALALNGNDITSSGTITIDATSTTIIPDADTFQSNDLTSTGALSLVTGSNSNINLSPNGTGVVALTTATQTGSALGITANSLTTGNGLSISSTSTAGGGSGSSYLINLTRSGSNGNASHTAYGIYSSVTNTGTTSTNYGGYFTASGATTNYPLFLLTTQPASVSGATGTTADKLLGFSASTGGDTTIATTGTGGTGSGIAWTLGNGGVASAATTTSTGGTGGGFAVTAGNGANASVVGNRDSGGTGGAIVLTAGNGGNPSNGTINNDNGYGGNITILAGNSGTGGDGGTGGGGTVSIDSGAGVGVLDSLINIGTTNAKVITIGNNTGSAGITLTTGITGLNATSTRATAAAFSFTDSVLTTGKLASNTFTSALAATGTTTGIQIAATVAGTNAANTYTINSLDLAAIAGSCGGSVTLCRDNAINIASQALAAANQTSTAVNIADQYDATGTHYGICFDCDGTYSDSQSANGINWGNDGNAVTLYRSASGTLASNATAVNFGSAALTVSSCSGCGSGGANTALSNLSSVAINTSLLPASDDSIDLGDNTHRFANIFLGGETIHLGTSTSDEAVLSYTTASNTTLFDNVAAGIINIGTGSNAQSITLGASNSSTALNSTNWSLTTAGIATLGASSASAGQIRLPNNVSIAARNAGGSADITLINSDSSDIINIGNSTAASIKLVSATVETKVNAASGSADAMTLSGTLGIFNGSDTFRGLYLNYTNADHTGSSNTFNGIDIASITGDAQATENAINIGSGWDNQLNATGFKIDGTGNFSGGGSSTNNIFNEVSDTSNTNLVVNPSFEVDTSNWAAVGTMTLAQSATKVYVGSGSMRVSNATATSSDGVETATMAVSQTTNYVGSVYIRNNGQADSFYVALVGDVSGETAGFTATLINDANSGFVRYLVGKKTTTDTTLKLRIKSTASQNFDIYVDAAQVEATNTNNILSATSYADGSMGPGYAWTGTANASSSTRAAGIKYLGAGSTAGPASYFSGPIYFEGGTGDINGDATITNVGDGLGVAGYLAGSKNFSPYQLAQADVNGDGKVSTDDVTIISSLSTNSSSLYELKRTIGNLYGASSTTNFAVKGTQTITGVGTTSSPSINALTLSGTLAVMDGSDTVRGLYLNYTNADHTGSTNVFNGIDIASITGDAEATESAIKIGSGWDSSITTVASSANAVKSFSVKNDAATQINLLEVRDLTGNANNFGSLALADAFVDRQSYWGDEFNVIKSAAGTGCSDASITTSVTTTFQRRGDWFPGPLTSGGAAITQCSAGSGELLTSSISSGTNNGQKCDYRSNSTFTNGSEQIVATGTANRSATCLETNSSTTAQQTIFNTANFPEMTAKVLPSAIGSSSQAVVIGMTNRAAAVDGGMAAGNIGFYFSNCTNPVAGSLACTGSGWTGFVGDGTSPTGAGNTATGCQGTAISTSVYSYLRIETRKATTASTAVEVEFFVDYDTTNGIKEISCGTVTTTAAAFGAGSNGVGVTLQSYTANATAQNLAVDYVRVWQDDSAAIPAPQALGATEVDGNSIPADTIMENNLVDSSLPANQDSVDLPALDSNNPASGRDSKTSSPTPFLKLDEKNNLVATISSGAKFTWQNSAGLAIGWVSDTGEAMFSKVTSLVGDFQKLVFGEAVVKKDAQTAGQATFDSGTTEVTINSDKVKEDSLINLTAINKTNGVHLYIKELKAGESFTVALERNNGDIPEEATASATSAIKFNWLIVNQQ